eukprot:4835630-Pleurochrysis_carterae.AAC.1
MDYFLRLPQQCGTCSAPAGSLRVVKTAQGYWGDTLLASIALWIGQQRSWASCVHICARSANEGADASTGIM